MADFMVFNFCIVEALLLDFFLMYFQNCFICWLFSLFLELLSLGYLVEIL